MAQQDLLNRNFQYLGAKVAVQLVLISGSRYELEAAQPSRGWWRRASFHSAPTYDGEKKHVPKTVVTGAPEQTCSLNMGKCHFTAGLNKHACLDWRLRALNFESTFNLLGNLGYDVFVKSIIKFLICFNTQEYIQSVLTAFLFFLFLILNLI